MSYIRSAGDLVTTPGPIDGLGYSLVENWDFGVNICDIGELADEFHMKMRDNTVRLNDEWERYSASGGNHAIAGGHLKLIARATALNSTGSITSGCIRTKRMYKYGYFECNLRAPINSVPRPDASINTRGCWPAFWMLPGISADASGPPTWPPEFDIYEAWNNGSSTFAHVHQTMFMNPSSAYKLVEEADDHFTSIGGVNVYSIGTDASYGFHTFGLLWDQLRVTWFVDGHPVYRLRNGDRWVNTAGAAVGPAVLIANLAIGGNTPGAPTSLSAFPIEMQINYMRVWQRPGTEQFLPPQWSSSA